MSKNRKGYSLIYLLDISFKKVPLWSLVVVSMGILLGVTWGANTLFTQKLFDAAEKTLFDISELPTLIMMLLLLGGVNILNQIVNCIGNISHRIYQSRLLGIFSQLLQGRIEQLQLIVFEDVNQLNQLERAKKGMETASETLLIFLLFIGFYFPYCLFMLIYLASLSPYLALILPLAFIPTILVQFLRTKSYSELEEKQAPLRRENEHYRDCISEREYFKETRSLDAFNYFLSKYQQSLVSLMSLERKNECCVAKRELFFKCITATGYIISILILLILMLNGEISLGSFSAVFASMNAIFSLMEEIVFYNISQLQSNLGAVRYYAEYLNSEPEDKGYDHLEVGKIEVCNISFSYPNATQDAIKNLSLSILPGEVIALVGENGSGKSTLVKLLTGQYFPQKGYILHNNIPTTEYKVSQISNGTSGIFQQFQKYWLSLKENILIGSPYSPYNKEAINQSLQKVAFYDEGINVELETILSREFGGTDLSGGEWQKVAIARGIFRQHEFIVLDEPVSAIDPLHEAQIYKQFVDIAKGKTVIIVTHRLSSVQFADRIVVLKAGEIVEVGSHKELLIKNGMYADMFRAQSEWYRMNT